MGIKVGSAAQDLANPKALAAAVQKAADAYEMTRDVKSSLIYLADVWRLTETRRAPAVTTAMTAISAFLREKEQGRNPEVESAPDADETLLNKAMASLWTAHRAEAAYDEAVQGRLSASAAYVELQRANIAAKALAGDLFTRVETLKAA